MDPDLRESLSGEAGDLYLGGDGLAIGDLNRADLTALGQLAAPAASDRPSKAATHAVPKRSLLGRLVNTMRTAARS